MSTGKYKCGQRLGYLTLISDTRKRTGCGSVIWECLCVCGKKVYRSEMVLAQAIRRGQNSNCGCQRKYTPPSKNSYTSELEADQ